MIAEPSSWTKADTISKFAIAIIGGLWSWVTYVRGRTFRRRLELKVSGEVFLEGNVRFLSIIATIRNVGLSKAKLFQEGTSLRMVRLQMRADSDSLKLPRELHLGTAPIFEKHGWVEPGEEIQDVLFLQLPSNSPQDIAVRLSLRVVSQELRLISRLDDGQVQSLADPGEELVRKLEWNVACIVPLSTPKSSASQEME
jgi:hypothetical protein